MDIVVAPHPIFKKKAQKVTEFNEALKSICEGMISITDNNHLYGIGANMVGVEQAIVTMPHDDMDLSKGYYVMINPEIIEKSDNLQSVLEASPSFPYIEAHVTRPDMVKVSYQDENGTQLEKEFTGFTAQVVQHEIDYLNGVTYLDHLPKVRSKMLLQKMMKLIKQGGPKPKAHVHGPNCNHHHH